MSVSATALVHQDWQTALREALAAGEKAATEAIPAPMLVGTPKNLLASLTGGDDGGFDESEPVYFVSEGPCGFAEIKVRGSRKFENYLLGRVKSDYPASAVVGYDKGDEYGGRSGGWDRSNPVMPPRHDSYYGGTYIWVAGYGQSLARKEAFARAFARSLNESLGDSVPGLSIYSTSRMD